MAWGRTKDKHYIQRTNYQIIAKIASYEDEKGLVEINIVSWFQKLPVIDIRRWQNGEPQRGFICYPGDFAKLAEAIRGIDPERIQDFQSDDDDADEV